MGIQVNDNCVHWNYFIALEQDLLKVSRFIEFAETNFSTYSIELAHLLLASSSEVDVVLKSLCNIKDAAKNHHNINDYKETILGELPELVNETCFIPRYGLELIPWSNWAGENNPIWWRSYNEVKHQRDLHFNKANLKNAINSLAALSIVVLYYYREIIAQTGEDHQFRDVTQKLQPESSLIKLSDDYYFDILIAG